MNKNILLALITIMIIPVYSFSQEKTLALTSEFSYEGCGCDVNIDLRIHNGLGDAGNPSMWGGQEVSDDDEYTKGAVTVANKNDTDGDGDINNDGIIDIPDYLDVDGVIGSSVGRDELDLMKLIIDIEGEFPADCQEKMKLVYDGDIAFYLDYRKINSYEGDFEFSLNELPTTLYVECRTESAALRDISIRALINEEWHDEVKATAVWGERTNVFRIRGNDNDGTYVPDGLPNNPDPFSLDFDFEGMTISPLVNLIEGRKSNDNSRYGFGTCPTEFGGSECRFGGRILFEYQVLPNDLELNELGVQFDIGRRRHSVVYNSEIGKNEPTLISNEPWPTQVEDCNDDYTDGDPENSDEDRDFSENSKKMYSYDAPGIVNQCDLPEGGISSVLGVDYFSEFEEFARIAIGEPSIFVANTDNIIGSRASYLDEWFIQFYTMLTPNSDAGSNLYQSTDMQFRPRSISANHSHPIFSDPEFTGNGNINIIYPSNIENGGYTLFFFDENWFLYNNLQGESPGGLIATATPSTDGGWLLSTSDDLEIEISSGAVPWNEGVTLYFNIFVVPDEIINTLFSN